MLRQLGSTKPGVRPSDRTLFVVVTLLAAAGLAFCLGFDQWVLSTLLRFPIHWDASIWVRAFTRLGKGWLQVWLLLVWVVVSPHKRRDVVAGLVALALVGVGVSVLKLTIVRPRPYETVKIDPAHHRSDDMSFPSGDTASAVATTTAIWPGLTGPAPYLLATGCVAIGWLRMGGLAHYPSDVLTGAAIGLLAGWLAKRLVKSQTRLQRELPFERWLVLSGIVGIPLCLALSEGFDEILLFLRSYGLLVVALVLARRAGNVMRTVPERVMLFLTRNQFPVLLVTLTAIITENILVGNKPRELLPFDDQPIDWVAVFGLLLVAVGGFVRLRARSPNASETSVPQPNRTLQRKLCLGMFLVVCGLLWQLRDPVNWLVGLPTFALFYGVPLLDRDWTLSLPRDARWWPDRVKPFLVRLSKYRPTLLPHVRTLNWCSGICVQELGKTLILLLLPLMIELLVEDWVFEGLLHQ